MQAYSQRHGWTTKISNLHRIIFSPSPGQWNCGQWAKPGTVWTKNTFWWVAAVLMMPQHLKGSLTLTVVTPGLVVQRSWFGKPVALATALATGQTLPNITTPDGSSYIQHYRTYHGDRSQHILQTPPQSSAWQLYVDLCHGEHLLTLQLQDCRGSVTGQQRTSNLYSNNKYIRTNIIIYNNLASITTCWWY